MHLKRFYFMGGPADGKIVQVDREATAVLYPVEYLEPVPPYDPHGEVSKEVTTEQVQYLRQQRSDPSRTGRLIDFFVLHSWNDAQINAELIRLGKVE